MWNPPCIVMGLKGVTQKGKEVADKGKVVANKASSVGKRKRSDDGKKPGRNCQRSNPGVLRFFEDSSALSEDSDFSDISDYFKGESRIPLVYWFEILVFFSINF